MSVLVTAIRQVASGKKYVSASLAEELPAMGRTTLRQLTESAVDRIEVVWGDGTKENFGPLEAGRWHTLQAKAAKETSEGRAMESKP